MKQNSEQKLPKSKIGRFLKVFFNVSAVLVILALMTLCAFLIYQRATGKDTAIFGYRIFQVQSGSMEPAIMTKDTILTKNIKNLNELKVGDIVVFKNDAIWESIGKPNMKGNYLVHRIVVAPYTAQDGKIYIVTLGDNNGGRRDLPTELQNVEALYLKTVSTPFYAFLRSPWGIISAIAILIVFVIFMRFIYAMSQKIKARMTKKQLAESPNNAAEPSENGKNPLSETEKMDGQEAQEHEVTPEKALEETLSIRESAPTKTKKNKKK